MVVVGVDAIPVVSVISFFIGLIIALQRAYSLRKFGALNFVVDMVAAEIGTMKIGEEVDALETMGLNPIKLLVVPKYLATLRPRCITT